MSQLAPTVSNTEQQIKTGPIMVAYEPAEAAARFHWSLLSVSC